MNYDPDNSRRPYLSLHDVSIDASLKMPDILGDMTAQIARKLAADQDALIRRVLNERLGRSDWTLEEVVPRVRWEIDARCAWKILTLDGKPILKMWPPECMDIERVDRSRYMKWMMAYQEIP